MAEIPQTDVSRRAALPTASLLPRSSAPTIDQDSDAYLAAIEEEWNKKVDAEVDTLVDGMVDIVSLAAVFPFSSSPSSASESRGIESLDHALSVLHVTARPPPSYNDLFSALGRYGYDVTSCEYVVWRRRLEQHVLSSSSASSSSPRAAPPLSC